MNLPRSTYAPLPGIPENSPLARIPVRRLRCKLWGADRTVVLFISEKLRQGQIRGLRQHLNKRLSRLVEWKEQLARPRSGPRSQQAADKKINQILCGQHINKILHASYDFRQRGSERLHYEVDTDAVAHLHREVFGKRFLITDRHHWPSEQIIAAYRGQSHVEATFRQLKDPEHLAVRPQYHWTDHKIHVHTFMCVLGLLLGRVVEYEARRAGRTQCLSAILEELDTIRLAMLLHPAGPQGGRPRCTWQIEQVEQSTLSLFRRLVPNRPPFVYTPASV